MRDNIHFESNNLGESIGSMASDRLRAEASTSQKAALPGRPTANEVQAAPHLANSILPKMEWSDPTPIIPYMDRDKYSKNLEESKQRSNDDKQPRIDKTKALVPRTIFEILC